VKSDLSVTIINQKGKLLKAEREKIKKKKNKSLFVSCGGCLIKAATTF
jgi:hypothetical protein